MLDTPPEAAFDRLTRLASKILKTPVALVSLVDDHRQFFKSQVGLSEPWATRRETPLSHSLCQHVVTSGTPLIVEDAREHELVRDSLAIPELGVIAYAGVPLVTADGGALGSFCAIDVQPRSWTDEDVEILRDLAASTITEIELRATAREASEAARHAAAQYAVGHVLTTAPSLDDAGADLLRAIGEGLNWDVGVIWTVDDQQAVLRPLRDWSTPGVDAEAFAVATRGLEFRQGQGLPGRVWANGTPMWLPDVIQDRQFLRVAAAESVGLHAAIAFPVSVDDQVIAVFEFLSQEIRPPDSGLLQALTTIGGQVAQFAERRDAEAALQQEQVRGAVIIDVALDCIVGMNHEGQIILWNPTAERTFGYTAEQAIGQELADLIIPTSLHERHRHALARYLSTGEGMILDRRIEITAVRANGEEFPVELTVTRLPQEGQPTFIGHVRDITARKQAEEDILRAKEDAEAANQAKSVFLATMSHELRTPLNAIIGYSELIQEEVVDLGQAQLVPDLERIRGAGKHLLDLINGILDLAKIEAGKAELYLETFDVTEMVREVVTTLQPLAQKQENQLEVTFGHELGAMYSDLTKVRQILFNLLSNACKFTEGGLVSLEVTSVCDNNDQLRFKVTDTGIGITPEQLARLFQPFSQADASTTRRFGGTGLGLTLSLRLSHMLNGGIEVASEPGHGSTFTVQLPRQTVASPPGTASAQPDAVESGSFPQTVLVIDGDEESRNLIAEVLRQDGFAVVAASTGEEGMRLAREIRPVVITLDVLLPHKDGWSVLAALKSDRDLATIPVVMVTVNPDAAYGYALGASDLLTKPVDADRLTEIVEKHRQEHAARRILIVEDDATMGSLLRSVLTKEGWTVDEATDGMRALAKIAADPPALILLDLLMPGMNGFTFLDELGKRPDWRTIPVVVVTAKDLSLHEQQRLKGDAEVVFQKGAYRREELLREVRNLVGNSGDARSEGPRAGEISGRDE